MTENNKPSIEEVRDDIVRILNQQTIRRVQNECQKLIEQKNIPAFQEFVENESDFILTERRDMILTGVQERLEAEESPGVILHGSYGSGKTVLMECVESLCAGPREIGGKKFPQIHYGQTEIDCFKISLQDHDSPKKFLHTLYTSLLESENLDERDLIDRFNEDKSSLSLDGLESLPETFKTKLKGYMDDPDSLEEIAEACKSLSAPTAHETLIWFAEEYYEAEGAYPGFYIDEFEQVFRHLDPTDEYSLKRLIKKMMRSAVTTHEELQNPPYILFINTVGLNELDDVIQAAEDLVSRLDQSISYNIDLSRRETKQLFRELYHLYTAPLLEDFGEQVPQWKDTVVSADPDSEEYIYPFTDDALEFALSIVHTQRDDDRNENVVRAFRAYKAILMAYLETWEGKTLIDRNYLYTKGDEVRNRISQLERADPKQLPGEQSIKEKIANDFEDESVATTRVLGDIARVGILDEDDRPALFSSDKIEEVAETELPITIDELIERGSAGADYFSKDEGQLLLDQDKLTGAAAVQETRSGEEIVRETVEELDITSKDTREQWVEAFSDRFATDLDIQDKGQYVEIDVMNEFQYTETVYFWVSSAGLPAELEAKVDSKALHPVVHLGPSDSDDLPAEFSISERNERAGNIMDSIASSLNNEIQSHMEEESRTETLLEFISDAYPDHDEFGRYRIFLKLSLADILGKDLPEEIRDRTADERIFDIPRFVRENVKGQYGSGKYVPEKLGLSRGYSGKDVLSVIYGIKHMDKRGDLIYDNPTDYEITREMRKVGGISRDNVAGEEFLDMLSKFSDEHFVTETSDRTYDIERDFSEGTNSVIKSLKESLESADEQELTFEEVLKTIFGTDEVASVTEAYVYLILSVVDLYEDPFVLSGDRDDKIVLPGSELETVRNQARHSLENAIKRAAITEAKKDSPNDRNLAELKDIHASLTNYDDTEEINQLIEELETDLTIDANDLAQSVRELGSEPVYTETEVSDYINDVRHFNEYESGLPLLIEDDLHFVIEQLEKAVEVLDGKETVQDRAKTIKILTGDSVETDAVDINVPCVESISDHLESHSVSEAIEKMSITEDVEAYINDEVSSEMLVRNLSRLRKSIVPRVSGYDPKPDMETISGDKEDLKLRFQSVCENKREDLEKARKQIEYYEPRISEGEQALIKKAERQIRLCTEELEKSIDEIDASEYNSIWESWKETEEELATKALGADDIDDLVGDLDLELDVEDVTNAETDLNAVVSNIDGGEEFRRVVESLPVEVDGAQKLQASLVKRRLQESEN